MTVASGTVVVSASVATVIVPAANATANASGFRAGSITAVVTNTDGAVTVRLGTSAVTASTGYELAKGASVTIALSAGDALYGFAESGSPQVTWLATG